MCLVLHGLADLLFLYCVLGSVWFGWPVVFVLCAWFCVVWLTCCFCIGHLVLCGLVDLLFLYWAFGSVWFGWPVLYCVLGCVWFGWPVVFVLGIWFCVVWLTCFVLCTWLCVVWLTCCFCIVCFKLMLGISDLWIIFYITYCAQHCLAHLWNNS